jgi:hypothetical protein
MFYFETPPGGLQERVPSKATVVRMRGYYFGEEEIV